MEITVSDLKKIVESIFALFDECGVEIISIENDYYWHIPKEEIYDPYHTPTNLNLGQLSDDWQDLHRVLAKENEPILTDFIDLASIFRAIGEITLSKL